jgi:hypothetical protein
MAGVVTAYLGDLFDVLDRLESTRKGGKSQPKTQNAEVANAGLGPA